MIKEFFRFLYNPTFQLEKKIDFKLFVILFIFYIFSTIPSGLFNNLIYSNFNISHNKLTLSPIYIIIIGCFISPIYEEIIFRLLLIFNKRNFIFYIVAILFTLTLSYLRLNIFYFSFLIILLLLHTVALFVMKISRINKFVKYKFKFFFWGSSVIFGLLHIANFKGDLPTILFFSIILVSSQIILGFILGYIRVHFGIKYSILFHTCVNIVFLLPQAL
jgi:membrane protease YdiL (CAAX protease family)